MPESYKYVYHGLPPRQFEDIEHLRPVFERAYSVRIVWLHDKPVRAERDPPARFGSPWSRLIYWLRSLLRLEGGRSWAIGRRDARTIIEQRRGIEQAWWSAHGASENKQANGNDKAGTPTRHIAATPAPAPEAAPAPACIHPLFWRQVCRFLEPDQVLAVAAVSKDARRSTASQALVARAMRGAAQATTLSAMLAVLDEMAGWPRRQDPEWPVPMASHGSLVSALAARVQVLLPAQRQPACEVLLDTAERLHAAGLRARALAAIARSLDSVRDSDRDATESRLGRLIDALPADHRYPALAAVLASHRTREARRAFTALDCTAGNWFAVVGRLPASEWARATWIVCEALLQGLPDPWSAQPPRAEAWDAMLGAIDRTGTVCNEPDRDRLKAFALEAMCKTWIVGGNPEEDEARWRALFERTSALPPALIAPPMRWLRARLSDLPEAVGRPCASAFRGWLQTAALPAAQRIELGAPLISCLPEDERGAYWEARWADWCSGVGDDDARRIGLARGLIGMLWSVPSLANWPAPLGGHGGSAPLAPGLHARLLTMLPAEAMRDAPGSMAQVLAESMRLAQQYDSPFAALWWYAAGALSPAQQRSVESILQRMDPVSRFGLLYELLQDERRLPCAATLAMNWLRQPTTGIEEGPVRIRIASLLARLCEEETRGGLALSKVLDRIETLAGELEASPPVRAQLQFATDMVMLGNTAAMAASLRQPPPREVVEAIMLLDRIWRWVARAPASMRAEVVQALLLRNPGSGRNTENANVYHYLSRPSLHHVLELVRSSVSSVPAGRRGDILLALAVARIDRARAAGFGAMHLAMWDLLRDAMPDRNRLPILFAVGRWLIDSPMDDVMRLRWRHCMAEYAALCDGLAEVDRNCVRPWRLAVQQALSFAVATPGPAPIHGLAANA
ncbi:hypothetical protein N6G02_12080 [Cupriavidus gilardii]|uniref:hypothetical protein n=1 Tax=Cupriavidus gilardii TaxID=82541 RepID=UPI0021C18311|nr:hypothetical protein [Cupriavidus gilardii]MCT9116865.1 hypothetical protein [Cupriavidus gilardii]